MASNTTNLNLYKKDPIADKDQTFNITTMMNENWDKIDQNAGQTATQLAQDATEAKKGRVQLATAAEVVAGINNTKAVVPKYLKIELDKKANKSDISSLIKIKKSVTISSAGWSKVGGYYQYSIIDSDITSDTIVDVNIRLEDLEKASSIKSSNLSSNSKLTIYAEEKPLENIICDLKLVRGVV